MTQRVILHIDFDSFFASVEQQDTPALRHKPLGVTAHNGRTAIIAASREAKKHGVTSPSRTYDAKKICPEIIFVTADFEKYFAVSQKFLTICSNYSPYVELFSLDEVFMDVTQTVQLFGGVQRLIETIKNEIKTTLGEYLTVSIGVSYNKLLAKLGSGLHKPNGITVITRENLDIVYRQAALRDICGIGRRTELRLHLLGVRTLHDLRAIPPGVLRQEFGPVKAQFLHNAGWGRDEIPVIAYTEASCAKSVGRQYCLPQNNYDWRNIYQHVYELCEEIGITLRKLKQKAQTFGFSLRGSMHLHDIKTKQGFFDRGDSIYALFKAYMQTLPADRLHNQYIRQIALWTTDLVNASSVPLSLFDDERKKEAVTKTIDAINNKFGDHTIRNGFLLYAAKLKTVPNGFGITHQDKLRLAVDIKIGKQWGNLQKFDALS